EFDPFDELGNLDDEELEEALLVGKKLTFRLVDLNVDEWLKALQKDKRQLSVLMDNASAVSTERDAKLAELKKLIKDKATNPTTNKQGEANPKMLIFTAFADTASYLYESLQPWVKKELGLNIALVTGGTKRNRTTFGKTDFNQILLNFSPRAKNRAKMSSMPQTEEIDILIATDCISEGQNLQDCDTVVNYDIHWNPVRLIQRFGRIDRIGSQNPEVQMVNFWPTPDLNKYINLQNRVETKMALVDITATFEDNLLATDELKTVVADELKYRDRQLLRLQDEVIDLEEFDESVTLSEFTLDDFRMELANFIESNRKALEDAPYGLYALVPTDPAYPWVVPGVIFCLRQKASLSGETDSSQEVNPLQPYFLAYVRNEGGVRFGFAQPKQILELYRTFCSGKASAYENLCNIFDTETKDGLEMTFYTNLLYQAVESFTGTFKKRATANLQSGRGGTLVPQSKQVRSASDFELISWLVIK
ncbi:MAG: C-terminal helicase domain-containing protein, partial [Chloroflexota bacterium]